VTHGLNSSKVKFFLKNSSKVLPSLLKHGPIGKLQNQNSSYSVDRKVGTKL
jgi:hypothetical protein